MIPQEVQEDLINQWGSAEERPGRLLQNTAKQIWKNAKGLMSSKSTDLQVFVSERGHSILSLFMLQKVYTILIYDLFFMIAKSGGPQPSYEQKRLIFQIRTAMEPVIYREASYDYLHSYWIERFLDAQESAELQLALTKCEIDPESPDCPICILPLGEESEEGTEWPVEIPGCGHAFGERCLTAWLHEHSNCPLCRGEIALPSSVLPGAVLTKEQQYIESQLKLVETQFSDLITIISRREDWYELLIEPLNRQSRRETAIVWAVVFLLVLLILDLAALVCYILVRLWKLIVQ